MTTKTAPRKTYRELLKHPNWQKKRLEILERHEFQCQACEKEGETLHVHHSYYEKGFKPWEYPDESLWCLCEGCHAHIEKLKTLLRQAIGKLAPHEFEMMVGFALGLQAYDYSEIEIDVSSFEIGDGVAKAQNVCVKELLKSLGKSKKTSGNLLREVRQKKLNKFKAKAGHG
ncbi:hypothetical protein LCGC14_0338310 [marine sediment metagenome]|uniref:HNH domain-containing protein n=1 Tax=marine sediment metagenome TaxID=412755 RepID=A0A0F9TXE0_9ZZZZ